MTQSKCYILNGGIKVWRNSKKQFHREDGPAVEHDDGYKEWWFNGQRHRLDGPAIEWTNGYKSWWINGKECTEQEFPYRVIMFLLNCDRETVKLIYDLF